MGHPPNDTNPLHNHTTPPPSTNRTAADSQKKIAPRQEGMGDSEEDAMLCRL